MAVFCSPGSSVLVAGLRVDVLLVLAPVFALSSAACAAGSLALARRAAGGDMLDASADLAELGISEREARELHGGGS